MAQFEKAINTGDIIIKLKLTRESDLCKITKHIRNSVKVPSII